MNILFVSLQSCCVGPLSLFSPQCVRGLHIRHHCAGALTQIYPFLEPQPDHKTHTMAAVDIHTRTVDQSSLPSRDRVEPGSFNIPLGEFPETNSSTPDDPDKIATSLIEKLNGGLASRDRRMLSELFIENCYWRDHLCFSWDYRTLKGRVAIAKYVTGSSASVKFEIDRSSALKTPHAGPIDGYGEVHGIEFFVKIASDVGTGQGVVRLAQEGNDWKFFTVFTSLVELTGYEESVNSRRPVGVQHGVQQGRTNWQDRRMADWNFEGKDPAVLIVGTLSSSGN